MKTIIIYDLEASCEDRDISNSYDNQIIEIGAVKLIDGKVVDEFQSFVNTNQKLTKFCRDLTSITQEDVDSADGFTSIVRNFVAWSTLENQDVVYASWGDYDWKQVSKDCKRHNLDYNWITDHKLNVKVAYANKKGIKPCGLVKAVRKENMLFEGTAHRGIDDARNIAKIYLKNLI